MFETVMERIGDRFDELFGERLEPIKQKWDALPDRDRLALSILGVVVALTMIYLLIWQPIKSWSDQALLKYENKQALVQWIEANRSTLIAAKQQGQRSAGAAGNRSILSLVNQQARRHKLTIKRVEPKGDQQLRLWVDDIKFNDLLAWLNGLDQKYAITVNTLSLDKGSAVGLVNATIILSN